MNMSDSAPDQKTDIAGLPQQQEQKELNKKRRSRNKKSNTTAEIQAGTDITPADGSQSRQSNKTINKTINVRRAIQTQPQTTGIQTESDAQIIVSEAAKRPPRQRKPKSSSAADSGGKDLGDSAVSAPKQPKEHRKKAVPSQSPPTTLSNFMCTICSSDAISHAAIGKCNHPICSLCALRLRSKNNDFSCTHCKSALPVMVVFPAQLLAQPNFDFSYFNLNPNIEEEFETVHPDVQCNRALKMLYFRCSDHFYRQLFIDSLHCPCSLDNKDSKGNKKCGEQCNDQECGQRFPNTKQLLQHVQSAHNGQQLCSLCLANRPLFVSEQQVFRNKAALKRHLNGKTTDSADLTRSGEPFQKPHPLCEFCSEHVFDSLALYQHMTSKHLTCALCDASRMFRFYKNVSALRAHHRADHFVCPICDAQQQQKVYGDDISCAFQQFEEFRVHMKEWHNERDCQRYLVSTKNKQLTQSIGDSGAGSENDREFFDLDLGAANPLPVAQFRAQRIQQGQGTVLAQHASQLSDLARQIPANMRIAGRVTGTGRFNTQDRDVMALQASIDELRLRQDEEAHRQRLTSGVDANRLSNELSAHAFPSLNAFEPNSVTRAVDKKPSADHFHPMSLVGKKTAKEIEQEALKAVENKRLEAQRVEQEAELMNSVLQKRARQQKLADAFGISESLFVSQTFSQLLANCDVLLPVDESIIRDRVKNLHFTPDQALFVPLFPLDICQWSRENLRELMKWEKMVSSFLAGSDPSLHCNPRPAKDRQIMHTLARYWQCPTMEYDREPKRYACLIKVPLSKPVSWSCSSMTGTQNLSSALKSRSSLNLTPYVSPMSNALHNSPSSRTSTATIFLVLNDKLCSLIGRVTEKQVMIDAKTAASPQLLGFSWRSVTPASLLLILQALAEQRLGVQLEKICDRVLLAGPNAIALEFDALTLALSLNDLCNFFPSEVANGINSSDVDSTDQQVESSIRMSIQTLPLHVRESLSEMPTNYWAAPVQLAVEINRAIQLQQHLSTNPTSNVTTNSEGGSAFFEVLKWFRVETDFELPTIDVVDTIDHSQPEDQSESVVQPEEEETPLIDNRVDAWSDDYVVLSSNNLYSNDASGSVTGENGASAIMLNKPECDDWEELEDAVTTSTPQITSECVEEEVVAAVKHDDADKTAKEVDEWDSFLAERRANSQNGALYRPPVRNQQEWEEAQQKRKERELEIAREKELEIAAQQQKAKEMVARAEAKKLKQAAQMAFQTKRSTNPFSFLNDDSENEED